MVDRDAKVSNPNDAKYKSYTRHNRDDEMSLVELEAFLAFYREQRGKDALFFPKRIDEEE